MSGPVAPPEWLAAVAVKELRQGLRSRALAGYLGVALVGNVGFGLVTYAVDREELTGRAAFTVVYLLGAFLFFLALPYHAYRVTARERIDDTLTLLSLTGVGPRRIVGGKFQSLVFQGLLVASALLPFLLCCYFLNGVSLPGMGVALLFGYTVHLFLLTAGICAGALPEEAVGRVLFQIGLFFLIFLSASISLPFALYGLHEDKLIGPLGIALGIAGLVLISFAMFAFEISVLRFCGPRDTAGSGPRLVTALVLLVFGFFVGTMAAA